MAAWSMVDSGDRVLVAVSGGPDSVALLLALHALKPRWDLSLGVAHLDHGLRPETAGTEKEFVGRLADSLGLAFFNRKADVRGHAVQAHLGIEEAGRELRYRFLEELSRDQGYRRVALGHNADDNAELVLMNLLRGTGPTGLSGIPPVRPPLVIRPLIELRRQELLALLATAKAAYLTDPSNEDQRFTRNRIRGHLLPLLARRYNPNIAAVLNRLSRITAAENEWMEQTAAELLARIVCHRQESGLGLSLCEMKKCHPALQRRLIRLCLAQVKTNLRRIGFVHVEAIRGLIDQPCGSLHLPGRILVVRHQTTLTMTRESTALRSLGKCRTFPCLIPQND